MMRLVGHTIPMNMVSAIAASAFLIGCGSGDALTVSFSRHPATLHLHVGGRIGVRKSHGECGSPWSTKPWVIKAQNPPRVGDCSSGPVEFKALSAGSAEIRGALPCYHTECAAVGAAIPVVVRGS